MTLLFSRPCPGERAGAARRTFRGVAQPGSAPAWGAGGRWFKSSRPDQSRPSRRGPGQRAARCRRGAARVLGGPRRFDGSGTLRGRMEPVNILITNDDGYGAEGLKALERSLESLGTVWVVAPDREQSGQGHALTLNHPLRFHARGPRHFVVQGTPTDCVYLAVHTILKGEARPRIVVSGINRGYNLGDDITYSGTVSAAFDAAGRFARRLAEEVLERGMPPDTLLNVNVPRKPPRGVRITRQGKRLYPGGVIERRDPKGRAYYWIGGQSTEWEADPESDFAALADGLVSVTPLHLDFTNHKVMGQVRDWNLEIG